MSKKSKKNPKVQNLIPSEIDISPVNGTDDELLEQAMTHYEWWRDDNQKRETREGGRKDITDAYWGKLPDDWPFISRTTDPRIRTSLLEKNARLTNRSLKGSVQARDDQGDMLGARINNAIISYQWDAATYGGSMQQKISQTDLDTRLDGSKFNYVYWRTVYDADGSLIFDGNEMMPLKIMDCGMDPNCTHVKDAKWFQHRSWEAVEDLKINKDLFPGLQGLLDKISTGEKSKRYTQKRRDTEYKDRIKELKGLEDRLGTDAAFPVVEKVIEYRADKWIIFCPEYNHLLAVFENPYAHKRIPIAQNRYYHIDGDNIGESEVEAVWTLWKAIQATMCAFLDEVILKMRPPLKVVEGAVRIETIVYEPEAQWLMNSLDSIAEVESRSDAVNYFQNTYPMLVSAFNTAMGDLSQGTSNIDPLASDKTATEVRQVALQQNNRDQKNQQELGEFIKDVVSMWMSNNKQFLFRNPEKKEHIIRIIGSASYNYFKQAGLDEMVLPEEAADTIASIQNSLAEAGQTLDESQLNMMIDGAKLPKYPIITNPEEEDISKLDIKSKMRRNEMDDSAELSIVPEDLDGVYDYIPDMKSMTASASEMLIQARNSALAQVTNPAVLQLLALEKKQPKISELLVANWEELGINDAQRFFETIQGPGEQAGVGPAGAPAAAGVPPTLAEPGMGGVPQTPPLPPINQ